MNIHLNAETFVSYSEQETENFAMALAGRLQPGTVVALHGDLGAGKTVFSRGFARGLKIAEPVSSPTYTIIQEYALPDGGWFFHLDLYRIDNSRSALDFGVDEYLEDKNAYIVVEWPERIADILPQGTLHLYIRHLGDDTREVVLQCKSCSA